MKYVQQALKNKAKEVGADYRRQINSLKMAKKITGAEAEACKLMLENDEIDKLKDFLVKAARRKETVKATANNLDVLKRAKEDYDYFIDLLKNNIVEFTFIKASGDRRPCKATLVKSYVEEFFVQHPPSDKARPSDPEKDKATGLIKFLELRDGGNEFRSCKQNSIVSIESVTKA